MLEWAVAMDLRNNNPCNRVVPVLGPQNDIVTHRQALPYKEVAAIETIRASGSTQAAVRLAFEFLVLTAVRSGEVWLATWDEIDTAGAVWTISATRMKAKRKHRVTLCERALETSIQRGPRRRPAPAGVPDAEREADRNVDAGEAELGETAGTIFAKYHHDRSIQPPA